MLSSRLAIGMVCASTLCLMVACSGSNFDVAGTDDGGSDTDQGGSDTIGLDALRDTGVADSQSDTTSPQSDTTPPPGDSTPPTDSSPPADTGCVPPGVHATDLYVDGSITTTGTGSMACPFQTILEATKSPLGSGTLRTIHVAGGSYKEADLLHVLGGVALRADSGRVFVTGGSIGNCTPSTEKCNIQIDPGGIVGGFDGFDIDATKNGNGVYIGPASTGSPPAVLSTSSVHSALKDGVVLDGSADLGPAVHVDNNAFAGVVVRSGNLHVLPDLSNSFDSNRSSTEAGIVINGTATLNFEGGSASNNVSSGILFNWTSTSSAKQTISGLVAQGNGGGGLIVPSGQSDVVLRSSVLTKNNYGAWFGYNSAISNSFDIGTTASAGGNDFGGATTKNTKVGVFLCHSGVTDSQSAEGNQWSTCAPIQAAVTNCDLWPASYADVGYVTATSITPSSAGANPATAGSCSVGP